MYTQNTFTYRLYTPVNLCKIGRTSRVLPYDFLLYLLTGGPDLILGSLDFLLASIETVEHTLDASDVPDVLSTSVNLSSLLPSETT